jgi:hypothetical protein
VLGIEFSNVFDATGVMGLPGWLDEGSGLSSFVRFFFKKFRFGIWWDRR